MSTHALQEMHSPRLWNTCRLPLWNNTIIKYHQKHKRNHNSYNEHILTWFSSLGGHISYLTQDRKWKINSELSDGLMDHRKRPQGVSEMVSLPSLTSLLYHCSYSFPSWYLPLLVIIYPFIDFLCFTLPTTVGFPTIFLSVTVYPSTGLVTE